MAEWPNSEMKSFPHAWCVCDEERGWWVCRIENRFEDPGDGEVYEEHNITVLHYAGDNQWSYEEDAYNPANFGETVKALDRRQTRQQGLIFVARATGIPGSRPLAPGERLAAPRRRRDTRLAAVRS